MAISIGEYANERRDLTYTTSAGDLKVTYAPNAMTPSDEVKLTAARGNSVETYKLLLAMVCKLVKAWDLVGPLYNADTNEQIVDADTAVPIQPEYLQHLPASFLAGLYTALAEDNTPKSSTPENVTQMPSSGASGSIYSGSFS